MTVRAYESPLRAEQAERTKGKILEALAEQLAEAKDDFSIPRVAERAGVSTRTVYHYFPNREAQIEALALWIDRRVVPGDETLPRTVRDLPAYAEARTMSFIENEALIRAQLASGVASSVRARRRRHREAAITAAVASTGLAAENVKLASALLKHLISAHIGVALIDQQGLTHEETKQTMRWVVDLVARALERGDAPRSEPAKRKR